jgi:hypothetical protein
MKASRLIAQLSTMIAEHGDVDVILQTDQEGNGFERPSGAEVGYVTEDEDYCYSDWGSVEDDAMESNVQKCIVVYP